VNEASWGEVNKAALVEVNEASLDEANEALDTIVKGRFEFQR
jgi:hypothetical protein